MPFRFPFGPSGWLYLLTLGVSGVQAQEVNVSAKIVVTPQQVSGDARHKAAVNLANVVVSLVPLQVPYTRPAISRRQGPYKLLQKEKQFSPHLLVVPTGTSVEFPNEDPFFHNVFSLFDGKRFDLGLYEPGTSRSVRFDREGVSYIFCNIHPEMGAVVLALNTPFFGISSARGAVLIQNVPTGSYRVNVWGENVEVSDAAKAPRIIQVSSPGTDLGEIVLQQRVDPMRHHKNKFGEEYTQTGPPQY